MSLVDILKRARRLIAAGWSEPFCRDSQGRISSPSAEDVERYSVLDAISHSAGSERSDIFRAIEALESVVSPRLHQFDSFVRSTSTPPSAEEMRRVCELARNAQGDKYLDGWLQQKGRQVGAVLRAFDIAILRASALERATRGAA